MSFTLKRGTTSVVLRNPDTANVERLTLNDIRRFTRGGDACACMDTAEWIQLRMFVYKFSEITNILHSPPVPASDYVIDQLKTFLVVNAGLSIEITDHLGDVRDGFILTPINEIIAVRPTCSYSVSFEFMEEP